MASTTGKMKVPLSSTKAFAIAVVGGGAKLYRFPIRLVESGP